MTMSMGSSGLPIPPLALRVDQKVEEAEFFLQLIQAQENVDLSQPGRAEKYYRFYASAFLNAVRSPLQYIFEEVKSDPVKSTWYQTAVSARPILAFMRNERNCNIHTMSTAPIAHHVVKFGVGVPIHEMHQEWPSYAGANKRVTAMAREAIDKVVEIIDDGKRLGYV